MFQNFIKIALYSAIQKWLQPRAAAEFHAPRSPFHPKYEKIKDLTIHYASFIALLFLNLLLFVGSLIVVAVAAAHSFDVYNQFVPTAVFWTGIVMGGTSLVIAAISGWVILSTKVTLQDVLYVEPEVQEPLSLAERLVRPFFEGVAEGLRKPRAAAYRGENESYPAA